jgi:site-specific DNA recombinase
MKRYLALARVSSREQEREGFSLDVQVDGLELFAKRQGGKIVKLFRIAETASKRDERKTFKELIAYAKKHAAELDGILFYKVDRAARNLFDYVELERLELDYGLPFTSVTQPTENTPAGWMLRRTLANMASFYTEQQSLDVREGLRRRVETGLFPATPPYGYRNFRHDGRGLVEVHPENGPKIRRIFHLYAYGNLTLDALAKQLFNEGIYFLPTHPKFHTSTLHYILTNRAYIGEIRYRGQWYPGSHEPLVDRTTWERVQVLLGGRIYHAHQTTYGHRLIRCGHCGHPITGEPKIKKTKRGEKEYIYYRCSKYTAPGHPRIRVPEADLDRQVLAMFSKMRVKDEKFRDLFADALRAYTAHQQRASQQEVAQVKRQHAEVLVEQDRLLTLRLHDEIDAETFAVKGTDLRDKVAHLRLQIEAADRGRDEMADIVVKAFELSQTLTEKWVQANSAEKRRILEIVCLNFSLNGVSLCPTMRKPFDLLVEGLLFQQSRGERI